MNESALTELGVFFTAVSDTTRLRILALMANGEVPVGDLCEALGESQPKVSRHLAYLRNAGLVTTRRDGKWIYYSIQSSANAAVNNLLGLTIRSIAGGVSLEDIFDINQAIASDDSFSERALDTNTESGMNSHESNEMEIFLL